MYECVMCSDSANYIDRPNRDFYATEGISALTFDLDKLHARCDRKNNIKTTFSMFKNNALRLKYAIRNHDVICKYKVYTKFTCTRSVIGSYQILYAIA